MFRHVTPEFWVSEQIRVEDVATAAAQGVTMIINNRPEEESADQTAGKDIAAAAATHGLGYAAIPVTHAGFSQPQIEQMLGAMDQAPGRILAYCRSGTRSTLLWALAQSHNRENGDQLTALAAEAGYDLSPIRAMMDMLSHRPE